MYVNPNSTIILCKNVPLDNTYENTIYFNNVGEQSSYFMNKAIVTLNAQTYQRVERGKMRVQVNAESIYTCNYLMFRNTAYGTKWFYAFVTGVEYVNDVTSEITFEIDPMQTYFFDYELLRCYVEREHSLTDEVGDNLVPESIDTPTLIPHQTYNRYWAITGSGLNTGWRLQVQVKPTKIGSDDFGHNAFVIENNQIAPQNHIFELTNAGIQALDAWLDSADFKNFEITNAFIYPTELITGDPYTVRSIDLAGNNIVRPTSYRYANKSGIYQPKNNKLFTYPYTDLIVTTPMGAQEEFLWEYSEDDGIINLGLFVNSSNKPSCEIRPFRYVGEYGTGVAGGYSRYTTISIDDFPQVQLAQFFEMSLPNMIQTVTHLGKMINAGKAKPKDDAINAGGYLTDKVTNVLFERASNAPGTTDANLDLKYETFGFQFYVMGPKGEDARIIDDYFSKYGYATKSIKVPNRNVRPHWTFTKTKGCMIRGNAPADDVRKICQIYDNGITFWKNGDEVGDYWRDNSPVQSQGE